MKLRHKECRKYKKKDVANKKKDKTLSHVPNQKKNYFKLTKNQNNVRIAITCKLAQLTDFVAENVQPIKVSMDQDVNKLTLMMKIGPKNYSPKKVTNKVRNVRILNTNL